MIKVLFLIHDLEVGGAEKVLVNLVNNMDVSRFDVTVMTLFDVGVNKQFLKKHINYKSCFKKPIRGNSHLLKLLSPEKLYKLLIKDEYDIVVSYLEGPTARIIGGAPDNVKAVSWIHSTIHNKREFARSFRCFNEAVKCYSRANKMVYVSESVKDSFITFSNNQNNVVLYNVNDSKTIIDSALQTTDFNFNTTIFNICCVGKLTRVKGFERMLAIQKRLRQENYNIHLHILGIGELENDLRSLCSANNLSDSVTFWGYQTNPYKYISKCDLFVCSSHSEGFSTAATEALIVGTPVCTVEVSGMKEMLGENNEYGIVTPNNEDDLYLAIKELLDRPELLKHYKEKAIERGKTFSTEQTVKAVEDMLIKLYEE